MQGAGEEIDTGTGLLLGRRRDGVATLTLDRPARFGVVGAGRIPGRPDRPKAQSDLRGAGAMAVEWWIRVPRTEHR